MDKLQAKYQSLSLSEQQALNNKVYKCPKCKDVGGFIVPLLDKKTGIVYDVWQDCECEKIYIAKNLLKASEITEEFKSMTFANFHVDGLEPVVNDMKSIAMNYYLDYEILKNNRENSIALLGQPGSGKTHILTALSNNMMQKKLVSVLYFPYVEGFNDLRDNLEKLDSKLSRMKKVEILFIDDLFKPVNKRSQATEWELKMLYSVINYRYMNHKPIFISSELMFNEIMTLDEALGSRIYEMCRNYFVQVEKNLKVNYRLRGI